MHIKTWGSLIFTWQFVHHLFIMISRCPVLFGLLQECNRLKQGSGASYPVDSDPALGGTHPFGVLIEAKVVCLICVGS